jgi:UDP-3-O-[3-hydroxymyristoyl] N-acetylglucosamine deacetylase
MAEPAGAARDVFALSRGGLHGGAAASAGIVRPSRAHFDGIQLVVGGSALSCGPALLSRCDGALATNVAGVVRTVEHWLAALVGTGRAGAIVVRSGAELPAMGSSLAAAEAIARSSLPRLRRACPSDRIVVEIGDGRAEWVPGAGDTLRVTYEIEFDSVVIGAQKLSLALDAATFLSEIAPARTFTEAVTMDEVLARQTAGVGAGLREGEALVAGPEGWLHGQPRWHDEPVRHKILDLLGDLGTLGIRPTGELLVRRGGHRLHRLLAREASRSMPWP